MRRSTSSRSGHPTDPRRHRPDRVRTAGASRQATAARRPRRVPGAALALRGARRAAPTGVRHRDLCGAEQRSLGVGARSALRTSDSRRLVRAQRAKLAKRVTPRDPEASSEGSRRAAPTAAAGALPDARGRRAPRTPKRQSRAGHAPWPPGRCRLSLGRTGQPECCRVRVAARVPRGRCSRRVATARGRTSRFRNLRSPARSRPGWS